MLDTPLNKEQEKKLYWFLLVLSAVALICAIIVKAMNIVLISAVPPCVFLAVTGYYCPGCGGSHAADALLSFHFLKSFLYHPAVLYFTAVIGWYVVSHSIEYLSHGRAAVGMRYRNIWLYAAAALIIGNWILRNILYRCFGITIY
jgi:hypothetical protein